MKKFGLLCLTLCCLFSAVFSLAIPASAQENAAGEVESYGCHSMDASMPLLGTDELITNARSIILYETKSGTLMYAWNADELIEPASLSKIMTALIAIDQGNMQDAVTVKDEVLTTVPSDAISIGLQSGEVLTLEQLLYCMMVSSANDAAAVIADHVSGSQALFVGEMNRYAEELGCTNTCFTNAMGLNDALQHTTARDLARILAKALEFEQFRTIFSTVSYTVPATNKSQERSLATGNYLMAGNEDAVEIYCDSRVTGGRTGITSDGTRSIAVSAESGNMELISIIIGAELEIADDGYSVVTFGGYQETSQLLSKGFADRQVAQILYENQPLTQESVVNGDCNVILGSNTSVFAILPQDVKQEDLSYRYSVTAAELEAPIAKGDNLAKVQVWHDNLCVAQADLYAMNDVAVKQLANSQDTTTKENSSIGTVLTVIGIALGMIILILVFMRITAKMRHAAANKRSRRNSRNRRRSR